MDAIHCMELTKVYKDITAVDHLTLRIAQGELFALLGVNGAGKTTTLHMLSCLTRPTCGDALILGHSILHQSAQVKGVIGVSPQQTAIAPHLTAQENLAFIAGVHGLDHHRALQRAEEIAQQLGLLPVLHRQAGKLSGGWQRRLSIGMALVQQPAVLFLDEPTLGLDVLARSDVWQVIRRLQGKTTIILTTHYMEEAQALADRVGIMNHGRLLALGSPAELMARTQTSTLEEAFITLAKEEHP